MRTVKLLAIQSRVRRQETMPEGQTLRRLTAEAVDRVAQELSSQPRKSRITGYLQGHVKGAATPEIAEELGVTREWCSRSYAMEALRLVALQFTRLITADEREQSNT